MLDENIMQFQVSGLKTREEVLAYLGKVMVDCGVVYESYPTAVLEREKIFPTGLHQQLTLLQDLVALLQDSQAMAAICQLPDQSESQEVLRMMLAQHGIL